MGTRIETTDLARNALYTKVNQIADEKANVGLDNLSNVGQMIIDTVDGKISNFMSEVPQNIKLNLENNVVTLKAGSIVLLGGEVYTTYTLSEDKSLTISSSLENGRYFLYTNNTGTPMMTIQNKFGSGTTLPEDSSTYSRFFITTNKTFYNWSGAQNAWVESGVTYPIAMIDVVNGVASFAKDSNGNDMIFNGAGFVGHHIFIYPNINAYMPTELNPDGSLASTKVNTNALRIIEALSGYGVDSLKRWISLQSNRTVSNWSAYKEVNHDSEADYTIANVRYYARDINLIKMYRSGSVSAVDGVPLVEYYYDGSNITSFTPKQCARLVTVDMLPDSYTKGEVDTLLNMKADTATTLAGYGITDAYTKTQVDSSLSGKASTSLDNLSADGQMIIDSQNGTISNCVLDIPQNIHLTLENNILTLKSGSVLTRQGSTYETYTTTEDYTRDLSSLSNGKYYIFSAQGSGVIQTPKNITKIGSGSSLPANNTDYSVFYLTTDKSFYLWGSNNSWENWTVAYPLCIIEVSSGVATFAQDSNGNDMIFNGAGFIGHHAFVYPNVKTLSPNGIKEDGTLRSLSVAQANLSIKELPVGNSKYIADDMQDIRNYAEVDNYNDADFSKTWTRYYVKSLNTTFTSNGNTIVRQVLTPLIKYTYNGSIVTDFTIRQPVRTATVEMLKDKQDVLSFDSTPTQNSTNPVTSGGVYNAINEIKQTYKGTHDSTVQYYEGDIVKSGTEFFEALQDNINVVTSNTTNWSKLSNDNIVRYYEKNDNVEYPIGLATSNASGTGYKGNLFFTTQNKPTINASTGVITATGGVVGKTETAGDNSTKYASTAFVQTEMANKFQVVTALPANPDANTFYFIVGEEENESEGE